MKKAATDRQSIAIPADISAWLTAGPDSQGQWRIADALGLRPFQHMLSGHEHIGQHADNKQRAYADRHALARGVISDRRKQLLAKVMGRQQVAELASRRFIWRWLAPKGNADKHPHCPGIIQRLFHDRAGQMNLYRKCLLHSARRWSVDASFLSQCSIIRKSELPLN
jgi:hypothetical protein